MGPSVGGNRVPPHVVVTVSYLVGGSRDASATRDEEDIASNSTGGKRFGHWQAFACRNDAFVIGSREWPMA